jgi:catechol 2,3-dioxygenase-like lactoylglutathione lyase family enzyme
MQNISAITVVVPDYDEAIAFYVGKLGFVLKEDTPLSETKRWVVVTPPGTSETGLLLAKAEGGEQTRAIGNQAGGRVFLFLETGDFDGDYKRYHAAGVEFLEQPRSEAYGKVVVFRDPFGNKWDLIAPLAK